MSSYYIDHIKPGSVNLGDRVRIHVEGTYQDAVNRAHEIWRSLEKKTHVSVHSEPQCLYFWHAITATGEVTDRNTNSGVTHPAGYRVEYRDNAYRAA